MIYLHKIMLSITNPLNIFFILMILNLKIKKKWILFAGFIGLYISSISIISNKIFETIEGQEYKTPINKIDSADAIVVLSGIMNIHESIDSTYIEWQNPDRYNSGIALLKSNKANKLIFTKEKNPWEESIKSEGEIMVNLAINSGIDRSKIFLTKKYVTNTENESKSLSDILTKKNKIILVTSAYHMNRAKNLFEKEGYKVIPYKTDYKVHKNKSITILDFIPNSRSISLLDLYIKEKIGIFYYNIFN